MEKRLKASSETDRISELPGHIRQHILSYVPITDAIATSVLSKTWRYDWLNLPCLKFGKDFVYLATCNKNKWMRSHSRKTPYEIKKNRTIRFLELLHGALMKGNHGQYSMIERLHLYLPSLKELCPEIACSWNKDRHKDTQELHKEVSRMILRTPSITELCLTKCDLSSTSLGSCIVNLPSLRDLSFDEVHINGLMVENLVANCAAIECLRFTSCSGFRLLKVRGLPKLRLMEQAYNEGLERIEIDAPKLDSLYYRPHQSVHELLSQLLMVSIGPITFLELRNMNNTAYGWVESNIPRNLSYLKKLVIWDCNVLNHVGGLSACKNIMYLELCMCDISDDWWNQNLKQLVNLKDLRLAYCHQLERIEISHNRLQTLFLKHCKGLDRVEAYSCPKISNFSYSAYSENVIELSLETSTLAHTCIDLRRGSDSSKGRTWHAKVLGLLLKLRRSKHLAITLHAVEDVMKIALELRQIFCPPFCEVEHLDLSSSTIVSKPFVQIMDDILWLFPQPKTLQIRSSEFDLLLKFTYKEPMGQGGESCGCYPLPINCWRHSVKDFEIVEHQGFKDKESLRRFFEDSVASF